MVEVPVIDIRPLVEGGSDTGGVATLLDAASRRIGFFSIVGHGVDSDLAARLQALSRAFFALPESEKGTIAMAQAGRAWRGWFPLGGELTSGIPGHKEGLYFGAELGPDHPRVRAGTPLHGANVFPEHPSELGPVVLGYMAEMARVSQAVLRGLAQGLGLGPSWFAEHLTADPLLLFRIFCFPPLPGRPDETDEPGEAGERWSVGEHTDYGLLTILGQDDLGGLQVHSHGRWVDVAPRPGTFVCNLGDMLERLTGGRYRSTPHRVRHRGAQTRLSFPFILDPSWDARVDRLPVVGRPAADDAARRWDHASVHGFTGTYGQYIMAKVGRVFPDLMEQPDAPASPTLPVHDER